jgi:hypothetical protein
MITPPRPMRIGVERRPKHAIVTPMAMTIGEKLGGGRWISVSSSSCIVLSWAVTRRNVPAHEAHVEPRAMRFGDLAMLP